MSEAFLKALKWYTLSVFVIIGASAVIISSETGSVKPIILGIFGFGAAYIMSFFWTEFREKVLFFSVLVFFILSFASYYSADALYILFAIRLATYDPYFMWAMTVGALGIPVMTIVFYRYD